VYKRGEDRTLNKRLKRTKSRFHASQPRDYRFCPAPIIFWRPACTLLVKHLLRFKSLETTLHYLEKKCHLIGQVPLLVLECQLIPEMVLPADSVLSVREEATWLRSHASSISPWSMSARHARHARHVEIIPITHIAKPFRVPSSCGSGGKGTDVRQPPWTGKREPLLTMQLPASAAAQADDQLNEAYY
jgi:hypothetical protein